MIQEFEVGKELTELADFIHERICVEPLAQHPDAKPGNTCSICLNRALEIRNWFIAEGWAAPSEVARIHEIVNRISDNLVNFGNFIGGRDEHQ